MPACPHGDPTCPCRDGDSCHYEWSPVAEAMECPNRTPIPETGGTVKFADGSTFEVGRLNHCHVEGCRWEDETCGLAKLGIEAQLDPDGIGWACAARRAAEVIMADLGW